MRRGRALMVLGAGAAMFSGVAACAGLLGFEPLSAGDGGADGSASGPVADGGADVAAQSCALATWPERPTVEPNSQDVPFVVAVSSIDFGLPQLDGGVAVENPGFDLDGVCTTVPSEGTCSIDASAQDFQQFIRDKTRDGAVVGVDNASLQFLRLLQGFTASAASWHINDRLQAGEFGAILRIRDYDGTPDDSEVRVEFFPTIGLFPRTSGPADGGGTGDGGDGGDGGDAASSPPPTSPAFDDTDVWIRDGAYRLLGSDRSSIIDVNAYVAGGKVVAHFTDLTIGITFSSFDPVTAVTFRDTVMVADVVPVTTSSGRSTYGLERTTFGGRWPTDQALRAARLARGTNDGGPLCLSQRPFYDTVKDQICSGRDVRRRATDDHTGAGALPCDALSVGFRVETYASRFATDFGGRPSEPDLCADSGIPTDDDCKTSP